MICDDLITCINWPQKCRVCCRKKHNQNWHHDYYKKINFWYQLCEFITDIRNYIKRKK